MIDNLNAKKEFIFSTILIFFLWLVFSAYDAFELIIEYLETHEEYELDEILLLFIISGVISTIFAIRRVIEANKVNKQLLQLNEDLENRIKKAIKEKEEQQALLVNQARSASMGEMIGNIAHQWRQPLNALGLVIQNIKVSYEMDELDDDFLDRSLKKANLLTSEMSKTIDDFRNFFKPNKVKLNFDIGKKIKESLFLLNSSFNQYEIKIIKDIKEEIKYMGFPNEFSHCILNILNNSKDAFEENEIEDRVINVSANKNQKSVIIEIKDNAGGIPKDIEEKIFDPYFTTKDEGKGTGIGLYMTKIIIEKNMNGSIKTKSVENGTVFIIELPLNN